MWWATVLLALAGFATAAKNMEVHEKYLTLPREEFIEYFNSLNYTFKIQHYEHLEGLQLSGSQAAANLSRVTKVHHYRKKYTTEENFDSRVKWPHCASISEIYNQGRCGSCWAFGTGNVMSDRTCIHTGNQVRLSQQDFVCLRKDVCAGLESLDAFTFWINYGLVTRDCLPYDAKSLRDQRVSCDGKCTNTNIDYASDKHYGDFIYGLEIDDYNIRTEIALNGPIEASFNAYEDFKTYSKGVYIHTFGGFVARHSVRVLGFGVEDGIEYWLVANSWGTKWGEKGYIKIKRYQSELEFEEELLTGLPFN